METPQDVLRLARQKIIQNGWSDRASGNAEDPYCVGIAMLDAANDIDADNRRFVRKETFRIFCEANGLRFKELSAPNDNDNSFFHGVYEWNDTVCDGGKEAIAAIDRALIATLPPVPDVSFLDDAEFENGDVDARELATVS